VSRFLSIRRPSVYTNPVSVRIVPEIVPVSSAIDPDGCGLRHVFAPLENAAVLSRTRLPRNYRRVRALHGSRSVNHCIVGGLLRTLKPPSGFSVAHDCDAARRAGLRRRVARIAKTRATSAIVWCRSPGGCVPAQSSGAPVLRPSSVAPACTDEARRRRLRSPALTRAEGENQRTLPLNDRSAILR
jgi:hypothetical protein